MYQNGEKRQKKNKPLALCELWQILLLLSQTDPDPMLTLKNKNKNETGQCDTLLTHNYRVALQLAKNSRLNFQKYTYNSSSYREN